MPLINYSLAITIIFYRKKEGMKEHEKGRKQKGKEEEEWEGGQ